MNEFNPLREESWRRKLTAAEEASLRAWLAKHPEAEADCEMEQHLTEALAKLADAPVPSNFTARVLEAMEREAATSRPAATRPAWFARWLMPRVAAAAVIFGAGLLAYHEHATARRAELVQGVKVVAGIPSLPGPDILQDFDTIRPISTTPGPDPELIALMK
jgi:anti-sigma factor RsiW